MGEILLAELTLDPEVKATMAAYDEIKETTNRSGHCVFLLFFSLNKFFERPRRVDISCDFMQIFHGYSDDVIPDQPLPNNFTNQQSVVAIQICDKLESFFTSKSCVKVSSIFEATWIAIIDISKIDVMF